MEKRYNPKLIEDKWRKTWEDSGFFMPKGLSGSSFCIVIPPPNVTGSLHMGHGFQYTLMDVLVRYHRMKGDNTLWQVGTDHAGISTQMVVARRLLNEGMDPYEMGREALESEIWKWKDELSGKIQGQMRRMGISVDWTRERFTMDEGLSEAVLKVFVDLYEEGLIYRGKRLVNWDPKLKTAVSDLEVVYENQDGFLWYIKYPVVDSSDFLVVATTRPETIFGDVAVAVNPDDKRYKHLIGRSVVVPFVNRVIPIIADSYVDSEFGTGCVKITPAHDFNDYAVGQRHNLSLINIFTETASLNQNVPLEYQGLDRFVARKRVVADLEEMGFLVDVQKHLLKVPKGDKTGEVIEPYLTDQWFVKMKPLALPAIEALKKGKIKFVPDNWNKVYLQWLENIEDWCVSRQIKWGHRVPAWTDGDQMYVGYSEADVRIKYKLGSKKLVQDEDVLDTWFSSALWPFSTLGWPSSDKDLETFYPTNVLVTGFDIIFFWVARMVMMGLKFTNDVPFREIYITGLIRDAEGQKMSKSKGNVLDPIDLADGISFDNLVEKRTANLMQPSLVQKIVKATKKEFPKGISAYGIDALRFTFCALASTGRNINFDIQRLEGYRNFCNKIWNSVRFVLMQDYNDEEGNLTLADRWINSVLQMAIKNAIFHIENYRFDLLASTLYEFVWHEYCDWYLEFYKAQKKSTQLLVNILSTWLRLIHPIIPFITEEAWHQISHLIGKEDTSSIMMEAYPKVDETKIDSVAVENINFVKDFINAIRNVRSENNVPHSKLISLIIVVFSDVERERVEDNKLYIMEIAKIESISWIDQKENLDNLYTNVAKVVLENLEIYVPLNDFIDEKVELERIQRKIKKLESEIALSNGKLSNADYVQKAPEAVVDKERKKLESNLVLLEKLTKT